MDYLQGRESQFRYPWGLHVINNILEVIAVKNIDVIRSYHPRIYKDPKEDKMEHGHCNDVGRHDRI
jgi:hypothetical protein